MESSPTRQTDPHIGGDCGCSRRGGGSGGVGSWRGGGGTGCGERDVDVLVCSILDIFSSSRKGGRRIFTGISFSTVSLCLSGPDTERPTARARSGSQSFHTELGGPPARRPAFKFSKEETRSRGESQRHPLRGHASVHVPLGAPVLVSVENIQSRGNRVGRKRTGGTDCVARRRDNCERTVSRSRLHEALRRRPMLCSGGHAQQVSYTYGVHGAW